MKNYLYPLLSIAYFGMTTPAGAQTPTHIDQGTTDDKVYLSEDFGYIYIIVALLIIMAIWYLIMRKRKKN